MNVDYLNKKSKALYKLKESSQLFGELENLPSNILQELETSLDPSDLFRPVVFLRYLILQKIKNKEVINKEIIEELKSAIENRDVSAFYKTSPELQKSLDNYKEAGKGMYPQWKEPFSILYPFFYSSQEKSETIIELESLGNEIISKYNIKNAKVHTVGFDGAQNYGSDSVWLAIIPEVSSNVQRSYQLFFRIDHNGLNGGLYKGHKVENDSFKRISKTYQTWDDFLTDIGTIIPEWEKLNNTIDFHFQNDEREFKNRVEKCDKEEVLAYFKYLDEIIDELSIVNEDNLVFSTARNQISFQIGNRYCFNLKKDSYAFIAPSNHIIEGVEKGTFGGADDALLYKEASRAVVSENIREIKEAIQFELERDKNSNPKEYDNSAFRMAVFDKGYRSKFSSLIGSISEKINETKKITQMDEITNPQLNQIFFGPPGTGKTFHTIDEAIKIINPDFYNQNKSNRDKLRAEYNNNLIIDWEATKGQIGFCTFHQSFSYEDFVEGIKPVEPKDGDTYLKYKVQEGIFKKICRLAEDNIKSLSRPSGRLISLSDAEFEHAVFYKISLGDINDPADQEIYDYCMEKGLISLGFGDGVDFSGKDESGVTELYSEKFKDGYGATALNLFKNYLKVGNYVIVSKGNHYIRALGKVTGEYVYDPNTPIRYKQFRKVEWIFKDQEIPVQDLYEKNLSQQSIYKLKSDCIKKDFFVSAKEIDAPKQNKAKNYVLVIDEINRGNVASIFGELITLIEKDKRAGNDEALEVVLPYSKDRFTVPPNLYIIGTMNTADRSIEALDTALRRRFSFREMPPVSSLIKTEGKLKQSSGKIGTIEVVALLDKINDRIEKLIDKDHKIGHSYFMTITSLDELKGAFKDKVIPLLEEYFFGDFGKIGLILGDTFVEKIETTDFGFAEFSGYDNQVTQDLTDRPVYKIKSQDKWDFESIYKVKKAN